MKENIESLIKAAEQAYASASSTRKAALEACVQAGTTLDKAKQAEADAQNLLAFLKDTGTEQSSSDE